MVIPETPRSSLRADTRTARRSFTRSTMRARRSAGIISWTSGTSDDTAVPPVRVYGPARPNKVEHILNLPTEVSSVSEAIPGAAPATAGARPSAQQRTSRRRLKRRQRPPGEPRTAVEDLTVGRWTTRFYHPAPEAPTVHIPRRPAAPRARTGRSLVCARIHVNPRTFEHNRTKSNAFCACVNPGVQTAAKRTRRSEQSNAKAGARESARPEAQSPWNAQVYDGSHQACP